MYDPYIEEKFLNERLRSKRSAESRILLKKIIKGTFTFLRMKKNLLDK